MSEHLHPIFTIGHSTHSLDAFVALLRKYRIAAVADVRSAPYSRFNPQFNRNALERSLIASCIKYVYLGRELGARSADRSCYVKGRVQYERLACTEIFRSGIDRVVRGASDYRVALMCAEKEPLECHRTLLVARALVKLGMDVQHILPDGGVESHEAAMARLPDLVGIPHQDLFRSMNELIDEALSRQEERIAYVDEKLAAQAVRETP